MRNLFQYILAGVSFISMSGCSVIENEVCTDIARSGIVLSIIDAQTQGAVVAFHATVTDGDFVESVTIGDTMNFSDPVLPAEQYLPSAAFAEERAGTYSISIESPGFESWQQRNVQVEMENSGCHVITQRVSASLERTN